MKPVATGFTNEEEFQLNPSTSKILKIRKQWGLILKYPLFLLLLFLMVGYESANPKLGKTTIEFYTGEFKNNLLSITPINAISDSKEIISNFYAFRHYLPAWTINFETNSDFEVALDLLKQSQNYGLSPNMYMFTELENLQHKLKKNGTDDEKIVVKTRLELLTTEMIVHFLQDLALGSGLSDTNQHAIEFNLQLPNFLNNYLGNNNLREGVQAIQPQNKPYVRLQNGLRKFLINCQIYSQVYTTDELINNDSIVAEILIRQGFLSTSLSKDKNAIESALRGYQRANSLDINGKTNNKTLASLCISTQEKYQKIALNLDRLRKDNFSEKSYILVNIPEFKLQYIDKLGKQSEFLVVVGNAETPTPVLTSKIEHIISFPYWTVPRSITVNEILPRLRTDSTYLMRNGFSILDDAENKIDPSAFDWKSLNANDFNYYFRQKDSQTNALGVLKFLFPNTNSIFIHDTPSKACFDKVERAYSHGCVRVKDPERLAEIILEDQENNSVNIKNLINKKLHQTVKLEQPIPLLIRYNTCSADSNGNIYFHPDIYNLDPMAMQQFMAYSDRP